MDYIPRSRCITSTYWHGLMSYRPSSALIEESKIFFCLFFIKLEWQSCCLLSFLPSDPYSRLLVCRYLVEKKNEQWQEKHYAGSDTNHMGVTNKNNVPQARTKRQRARATDQ